MPLTTRKRDSYNPELQKTKEYVMKPKMHKLTIWVPLEDYKALEIKGIPLRDKPTHIIRRLIKDYINN